MPVIPSCATPLYAGLPGLIAAMLTANVIVARVRNGVNTGDGGVAEVAQQSAPTPISWSKLRSP